MRNPEPTTKPGNVFERVWESTTLDGLDRDVLLHLAWDPRHDEEVPTPWPGYASIHNNIPTSPDVEAVTDAVDHLIEQGYLVLTGDLAKAGPTLEYEIRLPTT